MHPLLSFSSTLFLQTCSITPQKRIRTLRSTDFMFVDSMLDALERELRAALTTCVTGFVATARQKFESAVAEVAKERAKGLAEVAEERTAALAEVDARRAELIREVEAMHAHKEAQEGRVELNIGGYHFQTSVQALRRVPHTFFDAYFSGRYAQDVCDDGSIFVDRDGEHFGHVLEYMRDGVVSVAEPGAHSSVSLLRALKREFGFYCIELVSEQAAAPEQPEMAYVMGGQGAGGRLSCMERYDASSGQWSAVAAMSTAYSLFGACALEEDIYVIGGHNGIVRLSSVEKYSPASDTWSTVAPLPVARSSHAAVALGLAMYVLGDRLAQNGRATASATTSVLKYDSTQKSWCDVAPMPAVRWAFASCVIGSDIFVFGGQDSADTSRRIVFKFDTEVNVWRTLAPMPQASDCHSASVLDGLIYIVGVGAAYGEVFQFDPVSNMYISLAPTLSDRRFSCSFVLGGSLYAMGGHSQPSSVERYDVTSNTWTIVADMLDWRSFFCATTIGAMGPPEEQYLFDMLITKASSRHP
jgi:hypothetical protein